MRSLIVAVSDNGVIGNNNELPWHIPLDLKRFKDYTLGKTIVMGYNTYLSIGKLLPNRRTVILTSKAIKGCDITTYNNINDLVNTESDFVVIGGKSVYEQLITYVDELIVTEVHQEVVGGIKIDIDYMKIGFSLVETDYKPIGLGNNTPLTFSKLIRQKK